MDIHCCPYTLEFVKMHNRCNLHYFLETNNLEEEGEAVVEAVATVTEVVATVTVMEAGGVLVVVGQMVSQTGVV